MYYDYFQKSEFIVQKTISSFSAIAIDQAHKQNNAIVKGDYGELGLTENASALQRWMISGPEMACIIEEFQASTDKVGRATDTRHLEESNPVQLSFAQDVQSLTDIEQMGNPFTENSSDLIILDTRDIADPAIIEHVCQIEKLGTVWAVISGTPWWKRQRILMSQLKETNLPYFTALLSKNTVSLTNSSPCLRMTVLYFLACTLIAFQIRDGVMKKFLRMKTRVIHNQYQITAN